MEISFKEFDVEVNGIEVMSVDNVHVIQTDDLILVGHAWKGYVFMASEVLKEFDFTQSTFSKDSF